MLCVAAMMVVKLLLLLLDTLANFCGCKTLDQINRNNGRKCFAKHLMTHIQLQQQEWHVWVNSFYWENAKKNNRKCQWNNSVSEGPRWESWVVGVCVCLIETKRGHIKFYWWQYDKQATLYLIKIHIRSESLHGCVYVCRCVQRMCSYHRLKLKIYSSDNGTQYLIHAPSKNGTKREWEPNSIFWSRPSNSFGQLNRVNGPLLFLFYLRWLVAKGYLYAYQWCRGY